MSFLCLLVILGGAILLFEIFLNQMALEILFRENDAQKLGRRYQSSVRT